MEIQTNEGCRHSSVDLSAPSILPPQVRIPSTSAMLLSNYIWIVTCIKDENKQKEAGIGPFLTKKMGRQTKDFAKIWKTNPPPPFIQFQLKVDWIAVYNLSADRFMATTAQLKRPSFWNCRLVVKYLPITLATLALASVWPDREIIFPIFGHL